MRMGQFAIYNGTEYSFFQSFNHTIRLISNNPDDMLKGFTIDAKGRYSKVVEDSEVESAYGIEVHCKYKGYKFYVVEDKEDKVVIGNSTNESLVKLLQLDYIERGFYTKLVDKDEITDVVEIKNIYWENKK